MKLCPVCRMDVDEQEAMRERRVVFYAGRFHYFMCQRCKWAFFKGPERYTLARGRLDTRSIAGPCNSGGPVGG